MTQEATWEWEEIWGRSGETVFEVKGASREEAPRRGKAWDVEEEQPFERAAVRDDVRGLGSPAKILLPPEHSKISLL